MKKVEFGAKRPSSIEAKNLDHWVSGEEPTDREPIKRLTIDLPLSLHKRVKAQCAMENIPIIEVIRQFLDQRFPPKEEQGVRRE
jgi:hypothetical protein